MCAAVFVDDQVPGEAQRIIMWDVDQFGRDRFLRHTAIAE